MTSLHRETRSFETTVNQSRWSGARTRAPFPPRRIFRAPPLETVVPSGAGARVLQVDFGGGMLFGSGGAYAEMMAGETRND